MGNLQNVNKPPHSDAVRRSTPAQHRDIARAWQHWPCLATHCFTTAAFTPPLTPTHSNHLSRHCNPTAHSHTVVSIAARGAKSNSSPVRPTKVSKAKAALQEARQVRANLANGPKQSAAKRTTGGKHTTYALPNNRQHKAKHGLCAARLS